MYGKHFNVNIFSRRSLRSFLIEQWLRASQIFEKKNGQMEDFFSSQEDDSIYSAARNVSSIELYKLLHVKSSSIRSKRKYKHKDSGDHLYEHPHTLDYSRIIIQTCQNKGCMCKPIIQGRPKCQIDDEIQADIHSAVDHIVDTNKTSESRKSEDNQEETSASSKIPSEGSEPKTATSEKKQTSNQQKSSGESEDEQSKICCCFTKSKNKTGKKKAQQETEPMLYEMCKKNPCDPCPNEMRFCVPSNFEQLLKESGDRQVPFIHCTNRDLCTCDKYDTQEGLKKGLRLPGKNICVQGIALQLIADEPKSNEENPINGEEPKEKILEAEEKQDEVQEPVEEQKSIEEEPKPVQSSSSTSKNTCCFCFKKKVRKKSSDKSVQTCKCCSNKLCQKEQSMCFCATDKETSIVRIGEPVCNKVKSIWICSKCGKIYDNSCRRCEKSSCPRNTIILPTAPGTVLSNDQTETLRTLIKLEAKQNFRQIDNILQELNEQKNEIKKLNDMYQSINNCIKSKNNVRDNSQTNGLNNSQKVYICEGCEYDVNRNILRTLLAKTERNQNFDDEFSGTKEWEGSYEEPDNKK